MNVITSELLVQSFVPGFGLGFAVAAIVQGVLAVFRVFRAISSSG